MRGVAVIADFGPLTAFAFIVAVVAVAYFRFTEPGEVLSWWAKLINSLYIKATFYPTITSESLAKKHMMTVEEYKLAVSNAFFDNNDKRLKKLGVDITYEKDVFKLYIGKHLVCLSASFLGIESYLDCINFTPPDKYAEYEWVLKPILTCGKCIAGQLAVWLYLLTFPFDLLSWVYVVSLASYLATWLLNKLNS